MAVAVHAPPTLDMRRVITAAHEGRVTHPQVWARLLTEAFTEDGWHTSPGPGGRWSWHASALGNCLRQQVLARAGRATDGVRLESQLTFDVGHLYHALVGFGVTMCDDMEVLGIELGGHHSKLPLAGRCDVVYRQDDGPVTVIDVKSESTWSGQHRRAEAKQPRITTARPEHQLQVNATALILADQHGIRPTQGWAVYVDKGSGQWDLQWVPIGRPEQNDVLARLAALEAAWARHVKTTRLPARLPMVPLKVKGRVVPGKMVPSGLCKPRSTEDARGLYCAARWACYSEAE